MADLMSPAAGRAPANTILLRLSLIEAAPSSLSTRGSIAPILCGRSRLRACDEICLRGSSDSPRLIRAYSLKRPRTFPGSAAHPLEKLSWLLRHRAFQSIRQWPPHPTPLVRCVLQE